MIWIKWFLSDLKNMTLRELWQVYLREAKSAEYRAYRNHFRRFFSDPKNYYENHFNNPPQ